MILHGYYQSSAAFRVRIALNLKSIPFESAAHHLRHGEQRAPEYLVLNPQGLVPTLEADGQVLTQSLAILEWLEETYPEPPVLPADPNGRARVRALAQICAVDIHPLNNLRVLRYLNRELNTAQSSIDDWYRHWVVQGFGALESLLQSDPRTGAFCHGDAPTLADICLVPQAFNARRFHVDFGPFPLLGRICATAERHPAFSAAAPHMQPDAE